MISLNSLLERAPYPAQLEKYLDDRRKGRANANDPVPAKLEAMDARNAYAFACSGPGGSNLYGAYSTAFSYEARARYVYALGKYSETLEVLQNSKPFSIEA